MMIDWVNNRVDTGNTLLPGGYHRTPSIQVLTFLT